MGALEHGRNCSSDSSKNSKDSGELHDDEGLINRRKGEKITDSK
jgi:hypothetical protein